MPGTGTPIRVAEPVRGADFRTSGIRYTRRVWIGGSSNSAGQCRVVTVAACAAIMAVSADGANLYATAYLADDVSHFTIAPLF